MCFKHGACKVYRRMWTDCLTQCHYHPTVFLYVFNWIVILPVRNWWKTCLCTNYRQNVNWSQNTHTEYIYTAIDAWIKFQNDGVARIIKKRPLKSDGMLHFGLVTRATLKNAIFSLKFFTLLLPFNTVINWCGW